MNKGKLYIVATPIGNLDDITLRALETLKNADLILSEDTRETDKVLKKYSISAPQISYRDQNHLKVVGDIMHNLELGKKIALVSDSGTPLISDPGFKLIKELIEKGFEIESIPGPSSVISALVVSGLPTDKFVFLGFLPKSDSQKQQILKKYSEMDATLIIFESPYRVAKLLGILDKTLGEREVCLVNDQTKIFEKVTRGNAGSILENLKPSLKGEFIVLVAKDGYRFN